MFAKRLREAITEKGISQKELAEQVGISVSALSQMLKGKTKPRQITLKAIARVLDIALEELDKQPEIDERLTVSKSAKLMNKSERFVRIGLQRNLLPFGIAIKTSSKYAYYMSSKKFSEYKGITFK